MLQSLEYPPTKNVAAAVSLLPSCAPENDVSFAVAPSVKEEELAPLIVAAAQGSSSRSTISRLLALWLLPCLRPSSAEEQSKEALTVPPGNRNPVGSSLEEEPLKDRNSDSADGSSEVKAATPSEKNKTSSRSVVPRVNRSKVGLLVYVFDLGGCYAPSCGR